MGDILRNKGILLLLWPLGWCLGVALQLQQARLSGHGQYVLVVLLALGLSLAVVFLLRPGRGTRARAGFAVFMLWFGASAALAWGVTGWRASLMQSNVLQPGYEGKTVVVEGMIGNMPQVMGADWRFVFELQKAWLDGAPIDLPARIQLSWYAQPYGARDEDDSAPVHLQAGQVWRLAVRLRAPHGNFNPHGFDYELWMWERGLQATGYVRTSSKDLPPELLETSWAHPIERMRQHVRQKILRQLQNPEDPAAMRRAGIVAALVTGDQNAIDRADWDVFRVTGVAHLVSISGLHISMFAWLAAWFVAWIWRFWTGLAANRRFNPVYILPVPEAALLGGLLMGLAYALFSGWGVPAQRAVVMLTCVLLLRLTGLRWPWWLSWLWACAAVLAWDPWALLQAGFWLSFVAVAILFMTDLRPGASQKKGLGNRLWQILRAQSAVTLALAPLTLILFGQASVVGVLANVLAIPWVTLVVAPTALGGLIWPFLWRVADWALIPMTFGLQFFSALPGAQIKAAAAPLGVGVLAALGALLLVMRLPWSWKWAGLTLFVPLLLWHPARPAPGQFHVMAVDIGQGNALLVQTAKHDLIYDTGPRFSSQSDAGNRILLPLIQALGMRPTRLILSHGDADHTGGAASILQAFPDIDLMASLQAGERLADLPLGRPCIAGEHWVWDGVHFDILYPDKSHIRRARSSNAVSCVLRIATDEAAVLLVGDLEEPQEKLLLQSGKNLQSQVLLTPHHGSKTSSSREFLAAVKPRMSWVQAGYGNRYGHPKATIVERYRKMGIQVFDTPRCGAMQWSSQRPEQLQCERHMRARYWHHQLPWLNEKQEGES